MVSLCGSISTCLLVYPIWGPRIPGDTAAYLQPLFTSMKYLGLLAGAVHIELPEDIAHQTVSPGMLAVIYCRRVIGAGRPGCGCHVTGVSGCLHDCTLCQGAHDLLYTS